MTQAEVSFLISSFAQAKTLWQPPRPSKAPQTKFIQSCPWFICMVWNLRFYIELSLELQSNSNLHTCTNLKAYLSWIQFHLNDLGSCQDMTHFSSSLIATKLWLKWSNKCNLVPLLENKLHLHCEKRNSSHTINSRSGNKHQVNVMISLVPGLQDWCEPRIL
jgi:hypothetical protein